MKVKDFLNRKIRVRVQLLILLTVCITLFSFIILIFARFIAQNVAKENLNRISYSVQYEYEAKIDIFFKQIKETALIILQELNAEGSDEKQSYFWEDKENIEISGFIRDEIGALMISDGRDNGVYRRILGNPVSLPKKSVLENAKRKQHYIDVERVYTDSAGNLFLLVVTYSDEAGGTYLLSYIKESAVSALINSDHDTIGTRMISNDDVCLSSFIKSEVGTYIHFEGENSHLFSFSNQGISSITIVPNGTLNMVRLVSEVDSSKLYNSFYIFDSVTLIIMALMLLSLTALILIVSMKVVGPVEKLSRDIAVFNGRPEDIEKHMAHKYRYNEFVELYNTYDDMVFRITNLIEKNNEEMEKQRELELAALQVQINPHFLYNTLDTVAWISKLKKQPDIEKLVISLARFFRISLHKGDKYIRVYEEIELIKNYINIEQIRFPERISLVLNIEEEIKFSKMIKILLQPIVEDSIKHGFADKDKKATVTINGYKDGGDIVFEIIDDGEGFEVPEDFLKKQAEPTDGPGGYGLKNVDERIKLEYGEKYGLFYESKIGVGTKATVRIKDMPDEE